MKAYIKGIRATDVLVIAIVLATVVAVAKPKISQAVQKNEIAQLCGALHEIRTQIALYKTHYNGLLPGQETIGGEIVEVDFAAAMTTKTKNNFGPYLDRIPVNPYNGSNSIAFNNKNDNTPSGAGWYLDVVTGHFRADDDRLHVSY